MEKHFYKLNIYVSFSFPDVCVEIILADSVFGDVHLKEQRTCNSVFCLDEASE